MQCDVTNGDRNRSPDLLPGFFRGGIGRCLLIVASLLPNAFLPWAAAVVPAIAWPEAAVAQDDAGDAPADEAAEPEGENLLFFYAKALGLKYIVVFLLLSFGLVALLVMCFMQIRRVVLMPPGLSQAFEAHLESKEYQQAYELAKTDDSYLGHVLAAGMGKLQSGYTASVEAMQEEEGEQAMKLEHKISYVSLVGALAPMFGLLGTVDDGGCLHEDRPVGHGAQAVRTRHRHLAGPHHNAYRPLAGNPSHRLLRAVQELAPEAQCRCRR